MRNDFPAGCRTAVLRGKISGEELREKYIDIPKYGAMCANCPNYGKCWTCPPYDFDPMEIWDRCEEAELVALQIFPEKPEDREWTAKDVRSFLAPYWTAVDEELTRMEETTPHSRRLNAGKCHLCRVCAREEGKPCRIPEEARYSLESLGGAVGALMEDVLHVPLCWGKDGQPPEYYVLVGALLREREDA